MITLEDKIYNQKWLNHCCDEEKHNPNIVLETDLKKALRELKKRVSKYILLDGWMAEDISMNVIFEEIFGEGLVE